jgi:hypothetical protein
MKATTKIGTMMVGCLVLLSCVAPPAKAQEYEIEQLLLDLQKLAQEKQILSDLYKGYEILSKGYSAIRDISKGSFDLHKAFLDGLLAVSPVVRDYKRVTDIINLQWRIVDEYKSAWSRFRQDPHFSPDELALIMNIYSGLFDQSVKNLSTLAMILTDGQVRANDAERLDQIDGLYKDMQAKKIFLDSFNNRTALLSLNRSADQNEVEQVKWWYGLTF